MIRVRWYNGGEIWQIAMLSKQMVHLTRRKFIERQRGLGEKNVKYVSMATMDIYGGESSWMEVKARQPL